MERLQNITEEKLTLFSLTYLPVSLAHTEGDGFSHLSLSCSLSRFSLTHIFLLSPNLYLYRTAAGLWWVGYNHPTSLSAPLQPPHSTIVGHSSLSGLGTHLGDIQQIVELIDHECTVDFIDINMGCPIDIVVNKGAGSALLTKPTCMKSILQAASGTIDRPITVKVRTGYLEGKNRIDLLIEDIGKWGANAVTIHGRSRQQRYSKLADWEYIYQCARKAPDALQVLGNGDVFTYLDWNRHKSDCPDLSTCMIARGALIKPWIFTEIKE